MSKSTLIVWILLLTYTVLLIGGTLILRRLLRWWRDRGKVEIVEISPTDRGSSTVLVRMPPDGYTVKRGDQSAVIMNDSECVYLDRATGRRRVVVNGSTFSPIQATPAGGARELDGKVMAKFLGNRFIQRIAAAGENIDWGKVAAILGIVAISGLIVIGFVLVKIAGARGNA